MNIQVDPDWWKSLFDEVYLITDARSVCDEEVTRREVDAICNLAMLDPSDRILDLCGGQGRHSIELAKRGFSRCTVFDYSNVLLQQGRLEADQSGCHVDFIQGNATDTKLPAASYDHVLILGNSLGYLPEAIDDQRIVDETFRLLTQGGKLLVDVTDGEVVREQFNSNAWHEIATNIVVCRQRELAENCIRAREIVLCKEQGLLRDQTYAIRTYGVNSLCTMATHAGFENISVQKGFAAHSKKEDYGFMNHRLLLTARKPIKA
jgi:D-alanine-D-alanine ligase